MPSCVQKLQRLVSQGPWGSWEADSTFMRLFTDPVFSCNPLAWSLQLVWHPVLVLLLIAIYQTLNVLVNGLSFLSLPQLQQCLRIWLEVTCFLGLLAPVGILIWAFGGFLYRQTDCKIFSLDHCQNHGAEAWRRYSGAGVSLRCLLGCFALAHLYPGLWCLVMGGGEEDECSEGACDLLSRLETWLEFTALTTVVWVFAMHWSSWWSLQSLWRCNSGSFFCDALSLASSLILSIAAVATVLVLLDPSNALEHTLQVYGSFFLVACMGTWSRFLQKRSGGWQLPLITATVSGVLAFALSKRAIEWYQVDSGLAKHPSLGVKAMDCVVHRVSRKWLLWAEKLDDDAWESLALKARALMTCATTLPACVMTFLSAVQFRAKRASLDSGAFCSAVLGIIGALLGFIFNVFLYQERPDSLKAMALEVARWLAPAGLGIVAGAAFKCYWEPGTAKGPCLSCSTHFSLVLAIISSYLATALLFSRFECWKIRSLDDVSNFIRGDARIEAVHIMIFLATMVLLSYFARTAYWRRQWIKRWQKTPWDHQGVKSTQRMSLLRSISGQWQQWAYDTDVSPIEADPPLHLHDEEFWELDERRIFGRRARMLRLQQPLGTLSLWEKLKLYRQSFVLTVQATVSSVFSHTDRVAEVRGFAPPIVSASQILCLWPPGFLARACRLGIILYLWYWEEITGMKAVEDNAYEIRIGYSDPLAKQAAQVPGLEDKSTPWGPTAAKILNAKGSISFAWFLVPSSPYEYALLVNLGVSVVLVLYWRATGLFNILDACTCALTLFIDSDSQCRKIILLRDGSLSPVVKVFWLLSSLIAQCLVPLHTILTSRYWLNPCLLLDVLLQQGLVPSAGQLLAVSGADMKDSLTYNSMLNDSALVQSAALIVSSALTVLGNPSATLMDICGFSLQIFIKAIKGPLDAHSLRLTRMRAIADALEKQRGSQVESSWTLDEGQVVRRFASCERIGGVDMDAISWITAPQGLCLEGSMHDVSWSVSFTEVPCRIGWFRTEKRLAAQISIPDPDLWVVWTLQLEGRHTWFRRENYEGVRSMPEDSSRGGYDKKAYGNSNGPSFSMEGQWVRWYPHDVGAAYKEVFRVEGGEVYRPGGEECDALRKTGNRRFALHSANGTETGRILEANDWGMVLMSNGTSNGTRWVRTGPEAMMEGSMYGDIRVCTRFDAFSDTTGVLTFQSTTKKQTVHLKGRWTHDYHWFEVTTTTKVSLGESPFQVKGLSFRDGAILVIVQYDHLQKPLEWKMFPIAERVETPFFQSFTGESVGGEVWHLPAVTYPSWWWAKVRRKPWSPPAEGHACMADSRDLPRFNYHKGPGRLVTHSFDARETFLQRDALGSSYFLGNDMVRVEKVTLTLNAVSKEFRCPTWCETIDLSGKSYSAFAEREGFQNDLDELSSPLELHAKLWPEVGRSELSDDDVPEYVQLVAYSPREQDRGQKALTNE